VQGFTHRALRASALKALGQQPGYMIYPWLRSRELIGSVRLCLVGRYIQVSYKERDSPTKGMLLEESVVLDVTRCTYGGKRYWFRCPTCNRRATTLFRSGSSVRMPSLYGARLRQSAGIHCGQNSHACETASASFECQRIYISFWDFNEDVKDDDFDEDFRGKRGRRRI
jgi:hypothetical protein